MQGTKEGLLRDGAARIENAIPSELLAQLLPFCESQVAGYTLQPGQKDAAAAPVYPNQPIYTQTIQHAAGLLNEMGFPDVRFLAGALIPKWPGEGRRGYHVDWWSFSYSNDAYRETPPQIGLLCYLNNATLDNGGLIVIPGSHRREVAGAYETWESWDSYAKEKVIEAQAGDAVILDPRALHSTRPNTTDRLRMCLTLWFLLDYAKLERSTRATVMLSIGPEHQAVGGLAPDFTEGDFRQFYFPHCKKPVFPITRDRIEYLRNGRTGAEIIGSAIQPGDDFVNEFQTYELYFGLGAAKAPRRVLECGSRFGYSLIAIAKGAQWAGVQPELIAVDCEADGIATNATMMNNVWRETGITPHLVVSDTKAVDRTNALINGRGTVDIAHVDGDHSDAGIRAELSIAMTWVKPNGLIVVDDYDSPNVRAITDEFAASLGIAPLILPTQHQTAVINLQFRTIFGGR